MKFYVKTRLEKILISIVVIISVTAFIFWLLYDPVNDFIVNVPGLDNRQDKGKRTNETIKIGEKFKEFYSDTSELSGKWPRFRGVDFDNINKDKVKLINKWGAGGPKILWRIDLGEGHAAPAVYNGKVYLLDYDEKQKADALRCFSLLTGKELWRRWYNVHVKRNHGMSRTIPAVNEKYIVTIGPKCHVMCTDPHSGEYIWCSDIVKEYCTEVPFW